MKKTIMCGMVAAWLSLASASAASIDFLSRYMFRGFTYSKGAVTQLTHKHTKGRYSLIGFVNYEKEINEADLTLDYTKQVGKNYLSFGYSCLTFPNTDIKNTGEFHTAITSPKISFTIFHDIKDVKGQYAQFTFTHKSLTALVAYNHHFLRQESGLSHAELKFLRKVGKTTLMLNYSHALDKSLENMLSGGIMVKF